MILTKFRSAFIKGLAAVLPTGLTLYLIYWIGVTLEHVLGAAFKLVLPDRYYQPGLGLVAGVALVILIGFAVNAWIVRLFVRLGEVGLARIPLVKSVYSAVRDLLHFFSADDEQQPRRVVRVTLGQAQLIGFLTRDRVPEINGGGQDLVAVYLPMSYQIGGYTLFLPRAAVEPIDLDVEDAMRLVLTAGLGHPGPHTVAEPGGRPEVGPAPAPAPVSPRG